MTGQWFREPEPEPDGWTNGEWVAVLVGNALVVILVVAVYVLETLFTKGE